MVLVRVARTMKQKRATHLDCILLHNVITNVNLSMLTFTNHLASYILVNDWPGERPVLGESSLLSDGDFIIFFFGVDRRVDAGHRQDWVNGRHDCRCICGVVVDNEEGSSVNVGDGVDGGG